MSQLQAEQELLKPKKKNSAGAFLLSVVLHVGLLALLAGLFFFEPPKGAKGNAPKGERIDAVMINTDTLLAQQAAERARKAEIARQKQAKIAAEKRRAAEEKAALEARLKAEQLAKQQAEQLAKQKAEQLAQEKAKLEAQAKAELAARLKAEQLAQQKAAQLAQEKAKLEAQAKAELAARLKAEQLAQQKAAQAAQEKAELQKRLKAEALAKAEAEKLAQTKAREAEKAKKTLAEERKYQAQLRSVDEFLDGSTLSVTNATSQTAQGGQRAKGEETCSKLTGYLHDICIPLQRNFAANKFLAGETCVVRIHIAANGDITNTERVQGSVPACGAAMESIARTQVLPAPPNHQARIQTYTFTH